MITNQLRITGMATGIDTDEMISKLMKVETAKVDKSKQKVTLMEWKQEAYREISNVLRGFKDEYFNVIKPTTNFRSTTVFNSYNSTVKSGGVTSSAVTASASSSAKAGNHTLSNVTLAQKAKWESGASVSAAMTGANPAALGNLTGGETFSITLDGNTKSITLANNYSGDSDTTNLRADIQTLINNAFGAGNITVMDDGAKLTFSAQGHSLTIQNNGTETTVDDLGFTSGTTNTMNLSKKLSETSFAQAANFNGGNVEFTINGVSFTFNQNDTIDEVMQGINGSAAGVQLSYSSLSDKFTLEAKREGGINNITLSDDNGTNLLGTVFGLVQTQAGQDASFTLDGVVTTRSSNTFTIDGVSYTLNQNIAGPIDINISANADGLVESIKNFVDKYNEVIDKINSVLIEEKNRDYTPLTDEQKEAMSEKDIDLWEQKAKSGLLRSDSTLQKIVDSTRKALYDSVQGVGISLYDIGITTSSIYSDRGKLVIDEEKLKKAIEDKPNDIAELFTKQSSVSYSDTANRSTRYSEEGLAQRLYDIIEDNIRFTRDAEGKKGILLEKAGIVGDITEFQNTITSQIEEQSTKLDSLLDLLARKETYYYNMFARMEAAIQSMNSQSSWLMAQTGGGQ